MHEDFAGNTLGTAEALELTSSLQTFTGSVSPLDTNDYYGFNLSNRSSFNMTLSGLGANADVELLNSGGEVLQTSAQLGTSSESLFTTLDAGSYYIKVYSGAETTTDYSLNLSATPSQDVTSLQNRDSLTGFDNPSFDTGVFTVGSSGQVSIDYLFDGGLYQGELAIFSLEGMEQYQTDLNEFIAEAARRALSNSDFGHVVISDSTEGARFHGSFPWEADHNSGEYLGVRTFSMRPGDTFGVMLVPNATVQEVFGNPAADGAARPLFSLSTSNPNDAFHVGQIADATGNGDTFIFEDLRVDTGSDRDYNDIIFRVRGATGEAVLLDDVIDPAEDWRNSDLGRNLLAYADASINFDSPQSNQPLVGIIDTGFNANNPDIDYSRIILGRDRIDGDNNPLLQTGEGNEHGTHVLGIIGATRGNGLGIDGINDQAPIWLGRAVGSGQWAESMVEFVDAAKTSGQPNAVVNLSFDLTQTNPDGSVTTRYELTPQERQALEYARQNNVLIVAAAGNNGGTMSALGQASQEFDNIITVGSIDYRSSRADYSSFGNGLDIVAYGGTSDEPVISTVDSGADLDLLTTDLDEPDDEISAAVQSIFEEIFTPESTNEVSVLSVAESTSGGGELSWDDLELLQKLTPDERQAYEDAIAEINNFISDYLNTGIDQNSLNLLEPYFVAGLDATSEFFNAFDTDLADTLLKALEAIEETTDNADVITETDADFSVPLDFGLGEMAGTSVAAAKVTGAASQVWAANPGLSYLQVKEILKQTAVDLNTPGWDVATGAGLVSLAAAVLLAKTTIPQPYDPEPFWTPTTWGGEGKLTPTERAADFTGQIQNKIAVQINGGVNIRSGPGTSYSQVGKISLGATLIFDRETQGELVIDPNGEGSSSTWYHLADGRGWMSAVYIQKISTPAPTPTPTPTFVVSNRFYSTWQKNTSLGAPTSGEINLGNGVIKQTFVNGYIIWNGKKASAYRAENNPTYNDGKLGKIYKNKSRIEWSYKIARFIRRVASPRGVAKIASNLTAAIDAARRNKWIRWIPGVRPALSWMQKTAKPVLYGARRILIKKAPLLVKGAKFITKPAFVKAARVLGRFGRFVPYVNLAVTALDIGLDLATAQTNEQKKRAQIKAGAALIGAGVGMLIGGVLGASAGGIGAVPGAIGGAGFGSSVATMAVDAYYWVSDNKQKIGNFFSSAGNKFKSVFGF